MYSVSRETGENFYLGMKLLVKVCGLLLPLDEIQHFPERGGGRDEERRGEEEEEEEGKEGRIGEEERRE